MSSPVSRVRLAAIAAASLATLVIAVALLLNWSWRQLNAPLLIPAEGAVYQVERGSSLAGVTADLAAAGLLQHPALLNWYARLDDSATRIHAGEYQISPGTTALGLLDKFNRGEVLMHQVTLIEGLRSAEVLQRLRQHPAIAAGTESLDEIMAKLGQPDLHPEGQFLPDTYTFPRGTSDLDVLRWAHDALQEVLADAWSRRSDDNPLTDPYEGLVLASIIEKETALDRERSLISGVFHSRMKQGMRLQTDPTVIYGLGEDFDGDLTNAHMRTDTPYNTYTRHGLPPTPIALAGRASIVAAFLPEESDALYFVATGESDGSHAFSATLDEHNNAVRRYLERIRNRNP